MWRRGPRDAVFCYIPCMALTTVLRTAVLAAAISSVALPVRAQGTPVDTARRSHILPALGLHVGTPQKASVAAGVVVGETWQANGRDLSRNLALFVEPGLGAGRASIAYIAHGFGSYGSGYGIAATALRTWKEPWQLDANQTYVGGEVLLWPILFTGPRVGLLRRVAGPETSKRWFVTLDFGFGL